MKIGMITDSLGASSFDELLGTATEVTVARDLQATERLLHVFELVAEERGPVERDHSRRSEPAGRRPQC